MATETLVLTLLAGAAGGAVLGVKGYLEVSKKEDFDAKLFLKSLILPVFLGLSAGLLAVDPKDAFIAGFVGKSVQEVYSARK
jgi:hypothetical protein